MMETATVENPLYTVEYDLPEASGFRGQIHAATRGEALAVIDRYVGLTRARILDLRVAANPPKPQYNMATAAKGTWL